VKWAALVLLAACNPIVCQSKVSVFVEPDTRPPVVVARCDGTVLARRACQDGGRIHREPGSAVILCDGVTLLTVKEAGDATQAR
jgi:hypothetical protein